MLTHFVRKGAMHSRKVCVETPSRRINIAVFTDIEKGTRGLQPFPKDSGPLKGQCHEEFAVLDQFWAKIITLRLYSLTKCFCKATTKISNEFYQRGLTIIKFLRIF